MHIAITLHSFIVDHGDTVCNSTLVLLLLRLIQPTMQQYSYVTLHMLSLFNLYFVTIL
jgi:hypothetical protein